MPRPLASRRRGLGVVLAVVLLLSSQAAQAQLVHEKPGRVKAANRRALREAQRTESPYKDSHLSVKPAQLKRGQSTQPQPQRPNDELDNEVDYEPTPAPPAKPSVFSGLRRKKKPQPRTATTVDKK